MNQRDIPETTLLNIELNSSCNLRCKWCALDHSKPRIQMRVETMEILFRQLAENRLPHLRRVDLHNAGETLLHADLPAMLSVIRRYKGKIPSKPVVGLLTNAMLLSEKKSTQIIRSRAVDQMRFSLDGGSEDAFEQIRVGARWDVVRENIMKFLLLNRRANAPITTEAICIIEESPEKTAAFSPAFQELLSFMDKVSLRHPHNWDGSVEMGVDDSSFRAIAEKSVGEPCFLLMKNMVVLPDGSVTICCNDLNARGVMGTIYEQPLDAFVCHPMRMKMIELFRQGKKEQIDLCRRCTGFYSKPKKRMHDEA